MGAGFLIPIKAKSIILYVLILVLGIFVASILYFYQIFYKADHFLPGVHIATVNVSGYDQTGAAQLLKSQFDKWLITPISFYYGDYHCQTTLKNLASPPDPEKLVRDVWEKEKERSIFSKLLNLDGSKSIEYPVEIVYDNEKINKMTSQWKETLEKDYVNARLEIDPVKGLIIVPSQKGIKIDVESTLTALPHKWDNHEKLALEIKVTEENPLIKESDLQGMGELSSFTTWYDPGLIGRSHNVVLATRAIHNTMVKPQEVFSFNQHVGPRSAERGYRDAMVIVGNKFEEGLGGGICQVSSTLYNACLLAGLKIVERHNHNLAVAYVPLGQDATVAYGLQDFRFQNNLGDPIYLWAQAHNGRLTMKIYGNLKYKQKIKVSYVVDQVIDFNEIRETKDDMEPGTTKVEQNGSPGYIVRSFRTFYNNDGSVARSEQLARDYYRPLHKLIYEGPPLRETPPGEGEEPPEPPALTPGQPEEPEAGNPNEDPAEETEVQHN